MGWSKPKCKTPSRAKGSRRHDTSNQLGHCIMGAAANICSGARKQQRVWNRHRISRQCEGLHWKCICFPKNVYGFPKKVYGTAPGPTNSTGKSRANWGFWKNPTLSFCAVEALSQPLRRAGSSARRHWEPLPSPVPDSSSRQGLGTKAPLATAAPGMSRGAALLLPKVSTCWKREIQRHSHVSEQVSQVSLFTGLMTCSDLIQLSNGQRKLPTSKPKSLTDLPCFKAGD